VLLSRIVSGTISCELAIPLPLTADSTDEDLESFLDQVEDGIRSMPRRYVSIILGDWNAKIGSDNAGSKMSWVHTVLETGMTEVNVCYNLHKRMACTYATQNTQTSPAGSGLGCHHGRSRQKYDRLHISTEELQRSTTVHKFLKRGHIIRLSFCATCPYS